MSIYFPCVDEYNEKISMGCSMRSLRKDYETIKNMSSEEYSYYMNNRPKEPDYQNSYIGDVIFGRRAFDSSEIDTQKYRNTNLFRGSEGDGGSSSTSGSYSGSNVLSHWQVTYGN